jgi:hypothetical protein
MVKIIYACEVCNSQYDDEQSAIDCETRVLPPCPYKAGDEVWVKQRYSEPRKDTIRDIRLGPSLLHRHEWHLVMTNTHNTGKSNFSSVIREHDVIERVTYGEKNERHE